MGSAAAGPVTAQGPSTVDEAAVEAMRRRLAGTNVSPDTLLATDYLNHFNEIVMMIELVPDMAEMLDDARAWKPLSYIEHFEQSQFAERDLAIEAYGLISPIRRQNFEEVVAKAHARVADTLREFDAIVAAGGDQSRMRNLSMEATRELHHLVDCINVIIHGGSIALDQPDIDGMFQNVPKSAISGQGDIDALFDNAPPPAPATSGQDDIDALFK